MREIKFRAWFPSDRKFLHFDRCHLNLEYGLLSFGVTEEEFQGIANIPYGWDNLIAMQYTGLKDKNGKEIYEGDILSPSNREVKFGDFISLDTDGIPFSQGNGFYTIAHEITLRPMPFSFAHRQSEGCEVIGNIYENQELLK